LPVNAPTEAFVDDRAAALTFHLPQFVLHATPHAPQVDSDHAVPVPAGAVGGRGRTPCYCASTYFRFSVKKAVSLSNGISSTRS
jgi:hypothetical protein